MTEPRGWGYGRGNSEEETNWIETYGVAGASLLMAMGCW